jgi:Zn-finger nucleic acid-binding protein
MTSEGPASRASAEVFVRLVACPTCHVQYDVSTRAEARWRCGCGAVIENVTPVGKDAEVRRCGACGAAVTATDSTCGYCRAPLALDRTRLRLVCPECWVRNDERTRFCTHCGVRFDPQLLPAAEGSGACPACAAPLRAQGIGGVPVRECPRCDGLWVPGDRFDALVERAKESATQRPSSGVERARRTAARPVLGPVRYRKCPDCAQPMHRKNFARRSGILLDVCGEHGTWLDASELEGIAEFILAGGLAEAHRRAAEEATRQAATSAVERDAWIRVHTGGIDSSAWPNSGEPTVGSLLRVLLRRA